MSNQDEAKRSRTRIMVSLSREMRGVISKLASETSLSESRIAQELITRALGRKAVLVFPAEQELRLLTESEVLR